MKKHLLFTLLVALPLAASVLVGCGGSSDPRPEPEAPPAAAPGQKPEGQR